MFFTPANFCICGSGLDESLALYVMPCGEAVDLWAEAEGIGRSPPRSPGCLPFSKLTQLCNMAHVQIPFIDDSQWFIYLFINIYIYMYMYTYSIVIFPIYSMLNYRGNSLSFFMFFWCSWRLGLAWQWQDIPALKDSLYTLGPHIPRVGCLIGCRGSAHWVGQTMENEEPQNSLRCSGEATQWDDNNDFFMFSHVFSHSETFLDPWSQRFIPVGCAPVTPGPSAGLIGPGTAAVNAAPQTARPVKQVAPPVLYLGAAADGMVDFGWWYDFDTICSIYIYMIQWLIY